MLNLILLLLLLLVVSDNHKTEYIDSDEGSTQGDVVAMAFYALGIQPITTRLASVIRSKTCRQCWYADDSTAIGKLKAIKLWWDELYHMGPKYGYHPKPTKTVLIIKDKDLMEEAKRIFGDTGILISPDGERHLGAALGSESFRENYVNNKIEKWATDVLR